MIIVKLALVDTKTILNVKNHQLEQAEALMKDLVTASETTREVTDQVMRMIEMIRMAKVFSFMEHISFRVLNVFFFSGHCDAIYRRYKSCGKCPASESN